MSIKAALLLILTMMLVGISLGSVSTSKLQIHIPSSLSVNGGYDHRDALFGIPPYGGSIQEKLYYANDTLCGPSVNPKSGYPIETDSSGNRKPWQSPFILMVDRGDCTFVQKVRNAQRAGAAAVVIADSVCLCNAPDCHFRPEQDVCEPAEPTMADDGSGADISIPSFLVFKQDADKVKDVLLQNQPVLAEMTFSVPAPDSRVEYDLWTTPADIVSVSFLRTFHEAAVALGTNAYFTPNMFIYDGFRAGCRLVNETTFCEGLCTNNGRYCAIDPDNNPNEGISGADVVRESLRRICIWNLYGKADGIGEAWWKYVQEFMVRCNDPKTSSSFAKSECIEAAMRPSGVDKALVDQCMEDSGGFDTDVENALLKQALLDKEAAGVIFLPSIFVNNAPIRGILSFATVFRAICSGYAPGSEPTVCKTCATCHNEEGCVKAGKCSSGYDVSMSVPVSKGVSTSTFTVSLLLVVTLFVVAGGILYRRQQHHMRNEIRGIMAEYMPVDPSKIGDTAVSDDTEERHFTIS